MTQTNARTDWEDRIGRRSDDAVGAAPRLDPPTGLVAEPGGHQVTLTWDPVPGAVGYQVHVASSADGDLQPLDHHGRDVLAVPHPPYVDTTGPASGSGVAATREEGSPCTDTSESVDTA